MKKIYSLLSLLLVVCIMLLGCDKTETTKGSSMAGSENQETSAQPDVSIGKDDHNSYGQSKPDSEIIETPIPTSATLSLKQKYSDTARSISILGLKEYKTIKTEKYTDKASKGKKYLVLFLEVCNKGYEKDYFNVNYLTTKVDGKEIENTFLVNEPEGYTTIFANIAAGDTAKGFIVWEVPKEWKKLDVKYEGWRDSDGLTLNAQLTKKNLKNPE